MPELAARPGERCELDAASEAPPASLVARPSTQSIVLAAGEEAILGDLRVWTFQVYREGDHAPDGTWIPGHRERFLRASTCPRSRLAADPSCCPDCYDNAQVEVTVRGTELRVGPYRIRGVAGGRSDPFALTVERLACQAKARRALPEVGERREVWLGTEGVNALVLTANGEERASVYLRGSALRVVTADGVRSAKLRPDGADWTTVGDRSVDPPATEGRVGALRVVVTKAVSAGASSVVHVRLDRLQPPLPADPRPERDLRALE